MIGWLIIPFLVALLIGIPISFGLGIAVVLFILITSTLPFNVVIETMFKSASSFPLMAIPFFVLAGEVMNQSGITERLVNFAKFFLGRIRGGLSQAAVVSGAGFAGLSGSAVAETAALGKTLGKSMVQEGYNKDFVTALISSIGILAPVIPPSVIMILYGSQMNVSIGAMFVGGIIPGLMIALALMVYSYIVAVRHRYPKAVVPFSWKKLLAVTKDASLAFVMPIIIIFGIRGGVFTPTEGGAVAAAYAFVVGSLIYRNLSVKKIFDSLVRTGVTSAVIMLIVSMSAPFGWVMTYYSIPQAFAEAVLGLTENPILVLLIMIAVLLIVGMFLEGAAIVMLLGPVFAPLAAQIGMDPVHFAVLMVVAIAIGMVTPPVGVNLFVMVPIMESSLEKASRAILPFLIVLIIVLLFIAFVPETVLWLPGLTG